VARHHRNLRFSSSSHARFLFVIRSKHAVSMLVVIPRGAGRPTPQALRKGAGTMRALIDSSKAISWCASRRCRGSVADVATYLADRFADDATVVTESGRLTVVPRTPGDLMIVGPVRSHRAKVKVGSWPIPTRVTIEIESWSRAESELLVRPTRRPPRVENAYFAAVLGALEVLAAEIDATLTPASELATEEPLRRAS
jgi:hypothetical protein